MEPPPPSPRAPRPLTSLRSILAWFSPRRLDKPFRLCAVTSDEVEVARSPGADPAVPFAAVALLSDRIWQLTDQVVLGQSHIEVCRGTGC